MARPPADPPYPRPGVSAAVFRGGRVLIVERSKPPLTGLWSLPGGHIEPGEPARDAALREIKEETGIDAQLKGVADVVDVILRHDDGTLRAHYVLTVFYGIWLAGEAKAASDCAKAQWIEPARLHQLPLTEGAAATIIKAQRLLDASEPSPSGLKEVP